jgi:hypothetical protein
MVPLIQIAHGRHYNSTTSTQGCNNCAWFVNEDIIFDTNVAFLTSLYQKTSKTLGEMRGRYAHQLSAQFQRQIEYWLAGSGCSPFASIANPR